MKRFQRAGVAVLALSTLGLGGCGSLDQALDDDPNVGPCPVAGALYDASRVVEVKGKELHENVGFTGQIEGVRGFCRYTGANPITMELDVDFAFGRGPKADGKTHTYPYFVSVTRRDRFVIAKEKFSMEVTFPEGRDIVHVTESIPGIVIPRANDTVSGVNFEVIIGFDLTLEELAYNRSGTRFTINVAQPDAKPAAPKPPVAEPLPPK